MITRCNISLMRLHQMGHDFFQFLSFGLFQEVHMIIRWRLGAEKTRLIECMACSHLARQRESSNRWPQSGPLSTMLINMSSCCWLLWFSSEQEVQLTKVKGRSLIGCLHKYKIKDVYSISLKQIQWVHVYI